MKYGRTVLCVLFFVLGAAGVVYGTRGAVVLGTVETGSDPEINVSDVEGNPENTAAAEAYSGLSGAVNGILDTAGGNTAEDGGYGMVVHITGAVVNPGVYRIRYGSRLSDLVSSAGGFLPDAVPDAVNLAQVLQDGKQYTIPDQAEWEARQAGSESSGTVNLNTADAEKLMQLPGIGASKAEAIIRYREENGPFGQIEDIMKISGIKESAFRQIEDRITVN